MIVIGNRHPISKERTATMNEVRVYDAEGNLKKVHSPEELIGKYWENEIPKNFMRFKPKPSIEIICVMCGMTVKVQNKRSKMCGKAGCKKKYNHKMAKLQWIKRKAKKNESSQTTE